MSKTRQEIFDIAYRGLASQGFERSSTGDGTYVACLYRGPDGRKCAIGWLIPDSADIPAGEVDYGLCDAIEDAGISRGLYDFCQRLQCAHDESEYPDSMRHMLADFAAEEGLTIPEVSP